MGECIPQFPIPALPGTRADRARRRGGPMEKILRTTTLRGKPGPPTPIPQPGRPIPTGNHRLGRQSRVRSSGRPNCRATPTPAGSRIRRRPSRLLPDSNRSSGNHRPRSSSQPPRTPPLLDIPQHRRTPRPIQQHSRTHSPIQQHRRTRPPIHPRPRTRPLRINHHPAAATCRRTASHLAPRPPGRHQPAGQRILPAHRPPHGPDPGS